MKTYRADLDGLKGLAIIAVVFYHMGILKTGYLGVDLFFVINGFLVIPSLCRSIQNGSFTYFDFLKKRVIRLLPLIVIAMAVSLAIGYYGMLPDDYENVAQSVVATGLFSNNILSGITILSYWDSFNDFKPLMHMWYVGILMEFYIIIPLIVLGAKWLSKITKSSFERIVNYVIITLSILSLALYLNPNLSDASKFYYLQYRFFEIAIGGLIGLNLSSIKISNQLNRYLSPVTLVLLITTICASLFTININNLGSHTPVIGAPEIVESFILPKTVLLLLTVLFSTVLLFCKNGMTCSKYLIENGFIGYLGKMSFSIFVWHQVFLAFYRYYISIHISWIFICVYLLVIGAISLITYLFIEKKIQNTTSSLITWCALDLVLIAIAGVVYMKAGVVRDVPELDIYTSNIHRGMHAEYVDRVYEYQKSFPEANGKYNVLVVGVSFGRDFANVLLESPMKDSINLSYGHWDDKDIMERAAESDYIFSFSSKKDVPSIVWDRIKSITQVWGIGTKNYGDSNGLIYTRRNEPDYFNTTVPLNPEYKQLNDLWKSEWGADRYVDFIQMSLDEEGRVRVFSPEHKMISQDCEHLTKGGAQYYASVISWDKIFCR